MVAREEGEEQKLEQRRLPFHVHEDGEGIDIHGWIVRSVQKAIASSTVEEGLSEELGIKLPGMLFDKSFLQLTFRGERQYHSLDQSQSPGQPFELAFNAVDALKMVGDADPNIKVKAAERWDSKADRSDVEIMTIQKASDWTFSSKYPGTIKIGGDSYDDLSKSWSPASAGAPDSAGEVGLSPGTVAIDYDALRNTDIPILYSSQVVLFEDELDDNGTASYKVRIRVMPSFLFILARFFLRVDGVLVRMYDTRYFHRFGTEIVIRETVSREANLATTLKSVHPSLLRDPDLASQRIPICQTKVENIRLLP